MTRRGGQVGPLGDYAPKGRAASFAGASSAWIHEPLND